MKYPLQMYHHLQDEEDNALEADIGITSNTKKIETDIEKYGG